MDFNYVRRFCAYVSTFYHSEYITESINFLSQANHCMRQWVGMVQAPANIASWDTGMPVDVLKFVGAKSVTVPDDLVSIP